MGPWSLVRSQMVPAHLNQRDRASCVQRGDASRSDRREEGIGGRRGEGDRAGSLPWRNSRTTWRSPRPPAAAVRGTTRRFVVLAVAVGGATALLVVAQAYLIATVVAGAFVDHRSVGSLRTPIVALLAVIAGRAALAWAAERAAHRASASAKSELRRAAAARVATLGPSGLEGHDTGQLSVLMTTGIDHAGRLLLALPAPALPCRHRARHDHRRRRRRRTGSARH